ncbi:MAG: formylglycine-generating enzyme family protein [Myxococcales bacterium]|nr:formylglycine-generating enzyme family protein [Myxococcales bacterium]
MALVLALAGRVAGEVLQEGEAPPGGMLRVAGGEYVPFYPVRGEGNVSVAPFDLDATPVTNAAFLEFARAHPAWRRSRASPLFVDAAYLSHWVGDLDLGDAARGNQPVTFVSYFAAVAYCRSAGKRLPTEAEWEWAALATPEGGESPSEVTQRILAFYARPRGDLAAVGTTPANRWGIHDLHGLIWEWVEDFNASFASADNRQDRDLELGRFCGGASVGAEDVKDYAAFMRFGFRASLEARYALHHLGFRCARSLQ